MGDKTVLRARDFWTSIVLALVSVFFLFKTSEIPFFDTATAGVDSAKWYDSAALVPYGIFGALLVLALVLMYISVRDGGAKVALTAAGLDISPAEIKRLGTLSLIIIAYVFCLLPRVDFVISSALVITALIWGYHRGLGASTYLSALAVLVPSAYALVVNFSQANWGKPLDDDWFALSSLFVLTITMFVMEHRSKTLDRVTRLTPIIAIMCPLLLVMTMAFGFRQNVPNRTGLLFKHIEYHYYVTVRPLWQDR